jgi:hypothetical protein
MTKRIALLFGAVMLLGLFASPVLAGACIEIDIHNAVAQWANVPPSQVTGTTQLDGLGGLSWPQDAQTLINQIESICGCNIPPEEYEPMEIVDDIDEYVGVDDLEEQ